MAAKYFVYGAGRWRALDVVSGRVCGWRRRARFVFVRRGRLQLARRGAVLRALRALAAGKPGAAADGARLPHCSKERLGEKGVLPAVPAVQTHACPHHCCLHCHSAPPYGEAEKGTCAGAHAVLPVPAPSAPPSLPPPPPSLPPPPARPAPLSRKLLSAATSPRKAVSAMPSSRKAVPVTSSPRKEVAASPPPRKAVVATLSPRKGGPASPPPCTGVGGVPPSSAARYRELVIPEESLQLVREWVRRRRPEEVARYDSDESFRRALLYSINPVVRLRRLPAATLARYRRPHTHPGEKENTVQTVQSAQPPADAEDKGVASAGPAKRPQPAERPNAAKRPRLAERTNPTGLAHVISKRAGQGKEYSSLEDHCIVAWVSAGTRAAHVNGNALWRELAAEYARLAGRPRSWHSLRNRYLRYVLPALHALRLPPALQQRLRAAAAAGSIKTKSAGVRRNSLAAQAPVRSASNRVAARRAPSSTPSRSPSPSPAPAPATQKQASKSSSSTSSSSSAASSPARTPPPPPPARRSLRPRDASSSGTYAAPAPPAPRSPRTARPPRYSEVTRQWAARHRPPTIDSDSASSSTSSSSSSSSTHSGSSARKSASPAPAPRSTPKRAVRTRKLYNPNK